MQKFLEQWGAQVLYSIPNILTAIVIFAASLYLAGLAARVLRRVLERRRFVSHLTNLMTQVLYWSIVIIGLLTALERFFDVTAFLAGLGIIGFTVGFALQDIMKNFAAGIVLLLQQPFRVGEAISVATYEGTVLAVDLRATEMQTFDGRMVSIPNATVLTSPVINFTRASRRRVDVPLQVSPGADLEATRQIVLDAIRDAPGLVSEPAPSVVYEQIAGTSVALAGAFWVDVTRAAPGVAKEAVLLRIKDEFDKGNVSMPVPTSEVHLHSDGDGQPTS